MIIVEPMEDEVAVGHEGRRRLIVGCETKARLWRLIKAEVVPPPPEVLLMCPRVAGGLAHRRARRAAGRAIDSTKVR